MQDLELVEALQQGNQAALTQIYEQYKQDLWLMALALVNDRAAAEDVVHDVFVRLVQQADRWPSSGSLRRFLMVCLANRARNAIKSRSRREKCENVPRPQSHANGSPVHMVILNEPMQQLTRAMDALPYEQREVLMLHLHGQLSLAAIAKQIGLPVNTIKSRYRYALSKLRSLFALFDSEVR